LEQSFLVNDDRERIPYIERFEQSLELTGWNYLNPDNGITWTVTEAGESGNQAAYMNFFSYDQEGQTDYLASPVLDFSNSSGPVMTFKLAYAGSQNFNDGLLVLGSSNCGVSYSDTLFQAFGSELATVSGLDEFFPEDQSDWELHEIDLSKYGGSPEVRIAFAGINDFGNNLFIDDIQLFVSGNTESLELDPNQMVLYPNPSQGNFKVSFNLHQRTDLDLRILDPMGRTIWEMQLIDMLNQTLDVQLPEASGIYILQASGSSFSATRRIIVLQ
jgi:hypothetical protein